MHLNLSDNWSKIITYINRLLYVKLGYHNPIQSYTRQTHKKEKGIHHSTKYSHKHTKEESKRIRNKKELWKQETITKMAVRTYLPIITLNGNGIISSIKRHGVVEIIGLMEHSLVVQW